MVIKMIKFSYFSLLHVFHIKYKVIHESFLCLFAFLFSSFLGNCFSVSVICNLYVRFLSQILPNLLCLMFCYKIYFYDLSLLGLWMYMYFSIVIETWFFQLWDSWNWNSWFIIKNKKTLVSFHSKFHTWSKLLNPLNFLFLFYQY